MADDLAGRHICATSRTPAPASTPGLQETRTYCDPSDLSRLRLRCLALRWRCCRPLAEQAAPLKQQNLAQLISRRADDRRGQGRARGRRRLAEGPAVHRDHARGPVQRSGARCAAAPVTSSASSAWWHRARCRTAGCCWPSVPRASRAGRKANTSSRSCRSRPSRRACRPPAASRRASSTCSTERSSTSPTTAACSTGVKINDARWAGTSGPCSPARARWTLRPSSASSAAPCSENWITTGKMR